jgi:(1->4)-alpha-D-glucan 1-alpha-D-glucosylmutase
LEYEPFLSELERFVTKIQTTGRINSLSQTLLKHTVPGVPDTYQGSELWDLSLVDPDNRRPVDYSVRRRLLAELRNSSIGEIWERNDEGSAKMWTINRALMVRRTHAASFGEQGGYFPLYDEGAESEHFLGFRRGDDVITMVTRLPMTLRRGWGSTTVDIPQGRWTNNMTNEVIDGGIVKLKSVFEKFPVALLTLES